MKILNPNNTSHSITLQPRFDPTTTIVLELKNEVSKEVVILENTYTYIGGVMVILFDLTVKESDRYTIKLTENDIVIFRDKVFCTDQNTQDYKITKFIYG